MDHFHSDPLPQINQPGWTPIEWLIAAMNDASDRMAAVHWHDPRAAFAAVGEAVWWISILDGVLWSRVGEPYRLRRDAEAVTDLMLGLRCARNAIAHDADVLEYVEVNSVTGSTWVGGFKAGWLWTKLPVSTDGKARKHEVQYEAALVGKDVERTLSQASTFLRATVHQLGLA